MILKAMPIGTFTFLVQPPNRTGREQQLLILYCLVQVVTIIFPVAPHTIQMHPFHRDAGTME